MDLRLQRIYEPPHPDDGARVLVDGLWPRGVTKDKAALTLWLKAIAPSNALRQWYDHDPAKWDEFRRRYGQELDANTAPVAQLREIIAAGPTTLLFAAHDSDHSNAAALADYLKGQP
jgi:uncharacterized protein YeaO (DUF488 family)